MSYQEAAKNFALDIFQRNNPHRDTHQEEIDDAANNHGQKLTLVEAAEAALKIMEAHSEGRAMDAGFDGGEFSGPAHSHMEDDEIRELAETNGFTYTQVMDAMEDHQMSLEHPMCVVCNDSGFTQESFSDGVHDVPCENCNRPYTDAEAAAEADAAKNIVEATDSKDGE